MDEVPLEAKSFLDLDAESRGKTCRSQSHVPSEVSAELFKAGRETVLGKMHRKCVAIWKTSGYSQRNGRYPRSSHFPRKPRVKTETEIADEHAGFRQGRGTRNLITNLRILMHNAYEHHQQPLYMCFVDFKKAFDSILTRSIYKVWVTMMDM